MVGAALIEKDTLFDTYVIIHHLRGIKKATAFIFSVAREHRKLSVFSYMEILQGVQSKRQLHEVERFVKDNFDLISADGHLINHAIRIMQRIILAVRLSLVDALLAATALRYEFRLLTGNPKHFQLIKGLRLTPFVSC